MNDDMLPPGCDFNNEPAQAYENMVNQIQEIIDDPMASCKIDGYKVALEKIGFKPLFFHDEVNSLLKKRGNSEWYIDADHEYLLVIAAGADTWVLYEVVEWRQM